MTAQPSLREALSELVNAVRSTVGPDAKSRIGKALSAADSALLVPVSEQARSKVLMVEIPRDELALQIARACTGVKPPAFMTSGAALDELDTLSDIDPNMPRMGEGFRLAADNAVQYFHDCVNRAGGMQ